MIAGLGRLIGAGIRYLPLGGGKLLGGLLKSPGRLGEGFVGGLTGQGTRRALRSTAGGTQMKNIRLEAGEALPKGAKYEGFRGMGKSALAGQALGYGGAYGSLGYHMMGDNETVDEYGTKLPGADEDVVKAREKFQMDKLGGSSKVSKAKYDALKAASPWVQSAIKRVGKEQYMEMVKAVKSGELSPEELHGYLTDAIANDTDALKLAGKEAYLLPGLVQDGEGYNVYFMNPTKGKDGKTKWGVMPYAVE